MDISFKHIFIWQFHFFPNSFFKGDLRCSEEIYFKCFEFFILVDRQRSAIHATKTWKSFPCTKWNTTSYAAYRSWGLYICFIAYKIASAPVGKGLQASHDGAPGFADGFILNLLNPKVYAAFLAIFSQFLVPATSHTVSYFITGLICFAVAIIVDVLWLALGGLIGPLFQNPKQASVQFHKP